MAKTTSTRTQPKRTRKADATTKSARKPKDTKPSERKQPRITNGERLAELAAREDGFTLADVTEMLGILPHTARALVSTELRKKRGLNVVVDKETKRYRVVS